MDVRDILIEAVRAALAGLGVEAPDAVQLERPANPDHGDWSTNVALASAKAAGRNPRELGTELVTRLEADPPPEQAPDTRATRISIEHRMPRR